MNRKNAELMLGNAETLCRIARKDQYAPCKCAQPFTAISPLHYVLDVWQGPRIERSWDGDAVTKGNHEGMRFIAVWVRLKCSGCGAENRFGMKSEAHIQLLEVELMSPREEWDVPLTGKEEA